MKRYQVQDPTGQGFFQMVDTRDWKRVRLWRLKPFPHFRRSHTGNTYVVASFTPYCPDARRLADDLAADLNASPVQATCDFQYPDCHVMVSGIPFTSSPNRRPQDVSIVVVSGRWCPAAREVAHGIRLKLASGWPGTFTVQTIEDE